MKRVYRSGGVTLELSGGIADLVEQTIRNLAPTVTSRLEAGLEKVTDEARARWPLGKDREEGGEIRPHSRDLIVSELRFTDDAIDGVIHFEGSPTYVYMVKSTQNGLNGKSAYQTLLRKPAKALANTLAKELKDEIGSLMKRG